MLPYMPSRKHAHPPRTCRACARTFVPHDGRQRFCDAECRQGQYRVEYAARECPHCRASFVPTHGNAQFCSAECLYDFHLERGRKEPQTSACEYCGAVVVSSRPRRFCSERCSYASKLDAATLRHPSRVCLDCGVEFRKKGRASGSGRFCFACAEKRVVPPKPRFKRISRGRAIVSVRRRPEVRAFVAGRCPVCGEWFVTAAFIETARFCSSECCERASRQTHRDRKRAADKSEPIFRRKVFERDGWVCRLCRKPIERGAVVPHPKAATIDHILPLALGGGHTYSNVQTAHFLCNSKKSHHVTQLSWAA